MHAFNLPINAINKYSIKFLVFHRAGTGRDSELIIASKRGLVSNTRRILVLGVMDTSENPKIMKMTGFRAFPKWNQKITIPKRSRIILRSFWATLLCKFTIKMTPQTPRTPNPKFSRLSTGNSAFVQFSGIIQY